jgi:hypothetical protein
MMYAYPNLSPDDSDKNTQIILMTYSSTRCPGNAF